MFWRGIPGLRRKLKCLHVQGWGLNHSLEKFWAIDNKWTDKSRSHEQEQFIDTGRRFEKYVIAEGKKHNTDFCNNFSSHTFSVIL